MFAVTTENLTHTYSQGTPFEKTALRDVSVNIEKGAFVGIIGHTGSGKSTLVQHLNALMRPTSGRVLIDGEDIWADPKNVRRFRFKVGLVFQYPEYQLFEETVYRDIAFGPKNMGLPADEVDRRVLLAMRMVGLAPELGEKSPFELSGGQKRRVAIAGVMAMQPSVLVLDEPTAGLDPHGRAEILSQIAAYHRESGSTVLLVSHNMEDIARYAQKVLVLADSEVRFYDTLPNVFAHADELVGMGLAVPEVTRICRSLAQQGFAVDPNTYTVQHALSQLVALKKGGVRSV